MSKRDDWLTCQSCESEFRVVSDNNEPVSYCPYCGYDTEEDISEEDYDWED